MVHVDNLITDIIKKYRYMLHFVYDHLPINASSTTGGNKSTEIRNFFGEQRVKDELVLDRWKLMTLSS
ncbi:hypothetical protein H5410_031843, partial [Solanum commersonii]